MNLQPGSFGRKVAEVAKAYIDRRLAEFDARLSAIPAGAKGEQGQTGPRGEQGPSGESGPMGERGERGPAGERGEKGEAGEAVHIDTIRVMVLEEIGKAVGVLPRAQDGKSVTLEEITPLLQRMVDAIKPKDGRDGADGKDGADGINGKDGERGEKGDVGERGEAGPQGARGEKGADGVAGRDGLPGRDGIPGAQGEKGIDGRNGEDGLGFDDMTAVLEDDGRTVTLRYQRGDVIKEFSLPFPVPTYEGVWKQGAYKRGAVATYGGSAWHARRDTTETPGKGADWQLAVKKGKDA